MSNPNLEEARLAAYRGLVLAAAETEFAEKGEAGTLVKDIADRAGMSVGTVYKVFASKPAIYHAVLAHRVDALMETTVRAARAEQSAACRLFAGIGAGIEFFLENPTWARIHLRQCPWGLPPVVSEDFLRRWQFPVNQHARLIKRACDDKILRPGDPEEISRTILAVVQVLLDRELENPGPVPAARTRMLESLWSQFALPGAERCFQGHEG